MSSYNKYIPTDFESAVIRPDMRECFIKMTQSGNLQNMLFYGKPGTGKSSVARLFSTNTDVIRCDSITDGATDILKHAKRVAISRNLLDDSRRVVVLDEIDRFNIAIQEKVRSLIDENSGYVTFIATTNHLSDIILALRSRLKPISFDVNPANLTLRDQWRIRLSTIFHLENGQEPSKEILDYAMKYFPDGRQMVVNALTPMPF